MAADVIATQTVNSMLNEMSEYGKDLIHLNKHNGLDALQNLINGTYADELSDYFLLPNISQEAHNKVLRGEIKKYDVLDKYRPLNNIIGNTYTYLIQKIGEEETTKYLIDAIYVE
ncbi:hypothetical protein ACSTS3_04650 [Aquimarina muelleri]|uniref:hypothetical protein n=1 Tax=Aquimarina muelleri TaxID=279356 RepID=UPI003F6873FA